MDYSFWILDSRILIYRFQNFQGTLGKNQMQEKIGLAIFVRGTRTSHGKSFYPFFTPTSRKPTRQRKYSSIFSHTLLMTSGSTTTRLFTFAFFMHYTINIMYSKKSIVFAMHASHQESYLHDTLIFSIILLPRIQMHRMFHGHNNK